MSLPVLSLSLHRSNPNLFAEQLRKACHEVGFFLLKHDISESVCNRALAETDRFFRRSLEEKRTISYESNASFRGYMPLGVENTEGRIDGREQIEYAAEYGSRHRPTIENNAEQSALFYDRLRASNPWPDKLQPSLRPAITDYVAAVLNVAERLRNAMCLAMKVDPDEVATLFGGQCETNNEDPSFWSMKLVSYPPTSIDADDTTANGFLQGVGAHCDSNFLTLICQDSLSSGLQVQNVQGGWLDVPPTEPNTLICNIGELAELWTGGYLLATPHRVRLRPPDARSRISLPVFYNPKLDTIMEPIHTGNLPWERRGKNQWRRKHNKLMKSVGENSFKSLARSHPAVFEKFHGDLKILDDGRIVKR